MRVLGITISNEIFRIAIRILQLFSVDACRVAPEKQATIIDQQSSLNRKITASCINEVVRRQNASRKSSERVKIRKLKGGLVDFYVQNAVKLTYKHL